MDRIEIISGGQTGVDRGALQAALDAGLPIGGWCPAGRRAEDGRIPDRFPLQETESTDYAVRTRRNVRDADGTLILAPDESLSGGTLLTEQEARLQSKPYLVLTEEWDSRRVSEFVRTHGIRRLNVAGPRESQAPGIQERARRFLTSVFTDG